MKDKYLDVFEYEEYQDGDAEFVCFTGIKFLKDFGPWSKGQQIDCIEVSYLDGKVKELNESGDSVDSVCFTLQPISK